VAAEVCWHCRAAASSLQSRATAAAALEGIGELQQARQTDAHYVRFARASSASLGAPPPAPAAAPQAAAAAAAAASGSVPGSPAGPPRERVRAALAALAQSDAFVELVAAELQRAGLLQ